MNCARTSPRLAGQTRIVAEGDRRLSGVEQLEAVGSVELQRVARHRRSIPTEGLPRGVRPGPLPPFALMENRLFMWAFVSIVRTLALNSKICLVSKIHG